MSIEIKELKKINPFQLSQCIEISNLLFGKGYHSKKYFLGEDIVTIVALKKKNIIGFFIGKKEIKNMVIDCIAVKRSWQRKSVGTKLMTFYFQKFTTSKDKVVAYA
jgi:ribosomal protein S18 acetylase RimI-like enzyme